MVYLARATSIRFHLRAGSPFSISAPLHWRSTLTEQRRQTSSTGAAYLLSPDSPPLYFTQQCLETIHAFSHAPWWVVILGGTAVLRALVTLPLAVHQNKLVAKIELLQPTVKMMTESLRHRVTIECRRAGMSAEEAEKRFKKQHRKMIYDLYQAEGCNPLKLYLLPWCQLPLWFVLSLTLRNMSGYFQGTTASIDMVSEGALWFTDLTAADPTLILPCTVGLFNLANIELNALRARKSTRFQRTVTNSLRVLSIFMIWIASQVPAAMSLFWSMSACFGLVQNVVFKFPRVRRQLGIPKTPSESKTPFQDLKKLSKVKMELFLKHQQQDPWKK